MIIEKNRDLSSLNTFGLRSIANRWIGIEDKAELYDLKKIQFTFENFYILGGGSNLILPAFIQNDVLSILPSEVSASQSNGNSILVSVGAGMNWNSFVLWTLSNKYYGLENLISIPGNVGAAPIQNIGAYGVEVREFIDHVLCFDLIKNDFIKLSNHDCQFSYRDSLFKKPQGKSLIVIEVVFKLLRQPNVKADYGEIKKELSIQGLEVNPDNIARVVADIRSRKLPDYKVLGNAGSFFKNPIIHATKLNQIKNHFPDIVSYPQADSDQVKVAAGWLIERCGWKGKALGPVAMHEKQALCMVNLGGAKQADIQQLKIAIERSVKETFDIDLEAEPVFWS